MEKAIAGIDPTTKRCELVATDDPEHWSEARDMGLMVVPTTVEACRHVLGKVIDDPYSLARPPT